MDEYTAMNGNFILRFDAFIIGVGLASLKIFNTKNYLKMSNALVFFVGLALLLLSQFFVSGSIINKI
jgi:hypothetical protein